MKEAIFKTKFVDYEKYNNQKVKVLDYVGNNMYKIQFKDKTIVNVYDNELIFIGGGSLYE